MIGENPTERPEHINNIINGLERYNPIAVVPLESYLAEQCEQRFTDCNANRTLLKLYQLNPDRMKDEMITNILVKALSQFPSAQFSLAVHLINPGSAATGELHEALTKLRDLNNQLESAQYARFWATLDGDDLCADLIADITGFESSIRERICTLVSQAFREIDLSHLTSWLGLDEEKTKAFITEFGFTIDGTTVTIPPNAENEAKKSDIREDVNIEMFSKVVQRSWKDSMLA
ncbi:hypothetical protein Cpir12675_003040 [Ceratocystis pirilliformis]|uniref:Eukaryotic translation initiation factor 3 subunit K n=1 Tax=Ceratocystis pirilliformis TaxID=259994 RepID=A0ABR3Z5I4_9PEZI